MFKLHCLSKYCTFTIKCSGTVQHVNCDVVYGCMYVLVFVSGVRSNGVCVCVCAFMCVRACYDYFIGMVVVMVCVLELCLIMFCSFLTALVSFCHWFNSTCSYSILHLPLLPHHHLYHCNTYKAFHPFSAHTCSLNGSHYETNNL